MNRSLFRIAAHLQLALAFALSTGCSPTQPFFINESPDLQHYLNTATQIEYPDVEYDRLPEATQSLRPLTVGNHDYEFWDLSLEECVNMALHNSKFLITTNGIAEFRQNVSDQFISGQAAQFASVYDVAIQQSTTQSIPLTIDGNGNRLLNRGAVRANQVGGVEDALSEFDAVASGFVDLSTQDRPQNVAAGNTINPQFIVGQNTTQQTALSKRFATGGIATLRQQLIYSRNNTPTFDPANPLTSTAGRLYASDYTAIMEAQIQHPLMRGRGTYINRVPVMLAAMNEDIAIADYEAAVRNLVRDVEVAYWDLYVAYRLVATDTIARNTALATAEFAAENLEAGTGSNVELEQSVAQYFNLQRSLVSSLAGSNVAGSADRLGVYGRERELRALLGQTATDGRLIRPIDEPTLAKVEFAYEESVAQALYLSPELRRKKYELKQAELELALAKNQMLPNVNFSVLWRWVGLGDTLGPPSRDRAPFPARGSSSLASLTSGDFQEAVVRLEFDMPVGLRRELARVRNAQLRINQQDANLQESERLLIIRLSGAIATTASHYAQLNDAANEWNATEREVNARLVRFRNGIDDVNVVLQSQQRRAQAQIGYYRALAEYNKSINYVDFLRGTLLANSNVTLAEGPWNSKAYCDALERARERAAGHQLQYGVTRPGVVRTGPVGDANAAITKLGLGLPAGSGNSIAPINDVPLTEMGQPAEMFDPGPAIGSPELNEPSVAPVPDPSVTDPNATLNEANSILAPRQLNSATGTVAPMNYEQPIDATRDTGAPKPVRRVPIRRPSVHRVSDSTPSGQDIGSGLAP